MKLSKMYLHLIGSSTAIALGTVRCYSPAGAAQQIKLIPFTIFFFIILNLHRATKYSPKLNLALSESHEPNFNLIGFQCHFVFSASASEKGHKRGF